MAKILVTLVTDGRMHKYLLPSSTKACILKASKEEPNDSELIPYIREFLSELPMSNKRCLHLLLNHWKKISDSSRYVIDLKIMADKLSIFISNEAVDFQYATLALECMIFYADTLFDDLDRMQFTYSNMTLMSTTNSEAALPSDETSSQLYCVGEMLNDTIQHFSPKPLDDQPKFPERESLDNKIECDALEDSQDPKREDLSYEQLPHNEDIITKPHKLSTLLDSVTATHQDPISSECTTEQEIHNSYPEKISQALLSDFSIHLKQNYGSAQCNTDLNCYSNEKSIEISDDHINSYGLIFKDSEKIRPDSHADESSMNYISLENQKMDKNCSLESNEMSDRLDSEHSLEGPNDCDYISPLSNDKSINLVRETLVRFDEFQLKESHDHSDITLMDRTANSEKNETYRKSYLIDKDDFHNSLGSQLQGSHPEASKEDDTLAFMANDSLDNELILEESHREASKEDGTLAFMANDYLDNELKLEESHLEASDEDQTPDFMEKEDLDNELKLEESHRETFEEDQTVDFMEKEDLDNELKLEESHRETSKEDHELRLEESLCETFKEDHELKLEESHLEAFKEDQTSDYMENDNASGIQIETSNTDTLNPESKHSLDNLDKEHLVSFDLVLKEDKGTPPFEDSLEYQDHGFLSLEDSQIDLEAECIKGLALLKQRSFQD